ncbi:MAG: hypothetical protein HY600_04335, partial [Candidatus Omnitrophica bacterium]|nr:hypothetical protein [Candidatus Omnitrophota bacterium]
MTQPNDWQPELFTEFQAPSKPPWWARYWRVPQRFVVMRLAAEDLVLAAIAALMIMVLGFCLGVERGKRLIATAYSAPRQGAEESLPADRPGGTLPPP